MISNGFNQSLGDSQATSVEPMNPAAFDFEAYADYEADRGNVLRLAGRVATNL